LTLTPNPLYPPPDFPQEPPPPAPVALADDGENPPWTGWDVLAIALLTVFLVFVSGLAIAVGARHFLFPSLPLTEVAKFPLLTLAAQGVAYCFVFIFMVIIVRRSHSLPFWKTIRFQWPPAWSAYLLGGAALTLVLQILGHFLPVPSKELPIDRFFQTTTEAWVLSLFGITLAPLIEELFFRGFLYPVLVRRLGTVIAVVLTSAAFGLIHAPQLGTAWAPVLLVFLVGLTLTTTRAVTKSVAPGMLIHIAYNGTISVLLFVATDGFRHLEKLNR
jgi:membrane protease YdiL (CAAX protease family)